MYSTEEKYQKRIEELEIKIDKLSDQIVDLQFDKNVFKSNYNKIAEFIKELRESLQVDEIKDISKEQIIKNIKNHVDDFLKENNVNLNIK